MILNIDALRQKCHCQRLSVWVCQSTELGQNRAQTAGEAKARETSKRELSCAMLTWRPWWKWELAISLQRELAIARLACWHTEGAVTEASEVSERRVHTHINICIKWNYQLIRPTEPLIENIDISCRHRQWKKRALSFNLVGCIGFISIDCLVLLCLIIQRVVVESNPSTTACRWSYQCREVTSTEVEEAAGLL